MTTTPTVNGRPVTVREGVQVRVRPPGTSSVTPDLGVHASESAREGAPVRAISPGWFARQAQMIRNFASTHMGEARREFAGGWLFTEAPPAAEAMWRQVVPAKGEAGNVAQWLAMTLVGLFRAVVITLLWLCALSIATRKRAAAGLVVVLLFAVVSAVVYVIASTV